MFINKNIYTNILCKHFCITKNIVPIIKMSPPKESMISVFMKIEGISLILYII